MSSQFQYSGYRFDCRYRWKLEWLRGGTVYVVSTYKYNIILYQFAFLYKLNENITFDLFLTINYYFITYYFSNN